MAINTLIHGYDLSKYIRGKRFGREIARKVG
jgi:hypothetical protein